jgi:stearoyl-CoA desaturase (delta-9 desaturase)
MKAADVLVIAPNPIAVSAPCGTAPRADATRADAVRADAPPPKLPVSVLVTNLAGVTTPVLGVVAAMIFSWGWGFSGVDLALLLTFYLLTALGITVGFHRLFTHRSFRTHRVVEGILGVLGSMAAQGTLLQWVAQHRRHHAHSDQPGDPHSPHLHGDGLRGFWRGLWHAHLGWIFLPDAPDLERYVPDLRASRLLRVISAWSLAWVFLGLLLPAALGGFLTSGWPGLWTGLIWGGLVRIFLVHHVTWSVNSVCHLWGTRPYRSDDESRNNFIFGVLALGEGWHHTHHVFPTSARHGLRWWQIDVSYYFICALQFTGLARDVKVPSRRLQHRARRR